MQKCIGLAMCFRHQPGWVCDQMSEVVTVGSAIAGSATNDTLTTQYFIIAQAQFIFSHFMLETNICNQGFTLTLAARRSKVWASIPWCVWQLLLCGLTRVKTSYNLEFPQVMRLPWLSDEDGNVSKCTSFQVKHHSLFHSMCFLLYVD